MIPGSIVIELDGEIESGGRSTKATLMTTVGTGAQSLWDAPKKKKKKLCSSPRNILLMGEKVDYLSFIGRGLLLAT